MRHLAATCTLILSLLCACSSSESGSGTLAPVAQASMFFERELPFCGPASSDKIVLGYYGDKLLDTTVHLYILCQGKDTVFRDAWKSQLFLQGAELDLADSLATDLVHTRMRSLLDGPGSAASDSLPCPAKAFSYSVQTHQRCIAWSPEQGKSVLLHRRD
jgi:hypothetical protein